jgi:hypothetical protein
VSKSVYFKLRIYAEVVVKILRRENRVLSCNLVSVSRTEPRIRLKGVTGQFANLEESQAICIDARGYCVWSQLVAIGVATSREASRIMCRSVDN